MQEHRPAPRERRRRPPLRAAEDGGDPSSSATPRSAYGPTLCADCDGRCSVAAGTRAELGNLTRFLTYHEHHGIRTEARRQYAALSPGGPRLVRRRPRSRPRRLPQQARLRQAPARGRAAPGLKAHYTKYEYRIPMRDGKRLFTAVYVPKDQSQTLSDPADADALQRQPYGADQYPDNLGPSPLFAKAGYIFVYQDVRGRWMSEGEFVNMRPHIAAQEEAARRRRKQRHLRHHRLAGQARARTTTARSAMWGISYPGFYTAAGMIDAHPALKAVSPQAPVTDWFIGDDWHHNGALFLPHMFNFLARFGQPRPEPTKKFDATFDHGTPDGYDFFLKLGPLANADARYFKGEGGVLERGR